MNHSEHHKMMIKDYRKRFFISLILSIPIIILSPLIQGLFGYNLSFNGSVILLLILSTIIYFYGGKPFFKGMINEFKNHNFGMMTLVGVAISVSYFYSVSVVFFLKGKFFFWELATLIVVMLFGHWIEMKSVIGASTALESLAKLMPKKAHLVIGKKIIDTPINELINGSIVIIKPGEKLPADGVIIKGSSFIDESLLTGESVPVKRVVGDKVIGGSINSNGIIRVKVSGVGSNSYLSRVI